MTTDKNSGGMLFVILPIAVRFSFPSQICVRFVSSPSTREVPSSQPRPTPRQSRCRRA
jgi:hypothetical protein